MHCFLCRGIPDASCHFAFNTKTERSLGTNKTVGELHALHMIKFCMHACDNAYFLVGLYMLLFNPNLDGLYPCLAGTVPVVASDSCLPLTYLGP